MNKVQKLNKAQKPYCSFCGKSQDQVEKLIAGPNVFICNECVSLRLSQPQIALIEKHFYAGYIENRGVQ